MENLLKVYLAGKIEPDDWRQEIVDTKDVRQRYGESLQLLKTLCVEYVDGVLITGPYFIYHNLGYCYGVDNHGIGIKYADRAEVIDVCLHQIDQSDIVFAYVDDNTCYGTLFELGYAAGKGKTIILLFDCEERKRDMWFISEYAKYADVLGANDITSSFNWLLLRALATIPLENPTRQARSLLRKYGLDLRI